MKHLLVTNDFPPKVGGIQSYLYDLWRRLPPGDVTVVTSTHPDALGFDAAQDFRIERVGASPLLPTPSLLRRIHDLASEVGAELVLLDPVVPLGALALKLELPYGVVVHGAELVVPANIPGYQLVSRQVLRGASVVVAAGDYPAASARQAAGRPVPTVVVPPGVDGERFHPLDRDARTAARAELGLGDDDLLVLGLSRLVPRKGMDVLIQATVRLADRHPGLRLVIAGTGRDRDRLERLAADLGAPVTFLGAVADDRIPGLYASADVFAMLCRDRWGGLEQEGFGIVFLEASACGVPVIAGRSGGSLDAVVDDLSGIVVDDPRSVDDTAEALGRLLAEPSTRERMGNDGRRRSLEAFAMDDLARTLGAGLDAVALRPVRGRDVDVAHGR